MSTPFNLEEVTSMGVTWQEIANTTGHTLSEYCMCLKDLISVVIFDVVNARVANNNMHGFVTNTSIDSLLMF